MSDKKVQTLNNRINDTKKLIEDVKTLKRSIRQHSADAKKAIKENVSTIHSFKRQEDEIKSSLDNFKETENELKNAQQEIAENTDRFRESTQEFEKVKGAFHEEHEELLEQKAKLEAKLGELRSFYYEIFGGNDEDESEGHGIKDQIDDLHNTLHNITTDYQKEREEARQDTETLRQELENKIKSLLPEAGAAGLGGTYFDAKSKYGLVPLKDKANIKEAVFYSLKTLITSFINLFYYFIFIVPLLLMTKIFLDAFTPNSNIDVGLVLEGKIPTIDASIITTDIGVEFVLSRFLICTPLLIISIFGWSSIKMQRKLYEEYNHKQRVMQLYESFDKKIGKDGKKYHKERLLDIMLDTVSDKPVLVIKKFESFWDFIKADEHPETEK